MSALRCHIPAKSGQGAAKKDPEANPWRQSPIATSKDLKAKMLESGP